MNRTITSIFVAGIIMAGVIGVVALSDTAIAADDKYGYGERTAQNGTTIDDTTKWMGHGMDTDGKYNTTDKWMGHDMGTDGKYGTHGKWMGHGMDTHDKHMDCHKYTHMSKNSCHYEQYGKLTVVGTATTVLEPELLNMRLGVETIQLVASDALADNSQRLANITATLIQLGIDEDDIATTHFNIYPEYEYRWDENSGENRRVFIGYKVSNFVEITTTQMELGAQIVDGAVMAGATNVDSIRYEPTVDRQTQAYDSLLSDAVLDAKHKAIMALEPLDQKIIGVAEISLTKDVLQTFTETVFDPIAKLSSADSGVSTPLFGYDSTISESVVVVFLIGPQ